MSYLLWHRAVHHVLGHHIEKRLKGLGNMHVIAKLKISPGFSLHILYAIWMKQGGICVCLCIMELNLLSDLRSWNVSCMLKQLAFEHRYGQCVLTYCQHSITTNNYQVSYKKEKDKILSWIVTAPLKCWSTVHKISTYLNDFS